MPEEANQKPASIDIDRLKSSINIVDVIGRHVELDKRGSEYYGICPFHDDHKKSLQVNESKQIFKCFACDAGGDAIDFFTMQGMDFKEACEAANGGSIQPDALQPQRRPVERKAPKFRQVIPAPKPAKKKQASHPKFGQPSSVWRWYTSGGELIGYTCRYDHKAGKDILPLTYQKSDDFEGWKFKGFEAPRPLYDLQELARRPEAPALIVEGEKCVEAAKKLFPDLVVTSWMGGARAIEKTDWTPLHGRPALYLWPDNDDPGREAMRDIADMLAEDVRVIKGIANPKDVADHWDVADADWSPDQAQAYVKESVFTMDPNQILESDASSSVSNNSNSRDQQFPVTRQNDLQDSACRPEKIQLTDFFACAPENKFIHVPTRGYWTSTFVNNNFPKIQTEEGKEISASQWLSKNRRVDQVTWAPGYDMIVKNRVFDNGEFRKHHGCNIFNLYRPPSLNPGDASAARPWIDHVYKLYGEQGNHIINWFAHRVQRPGEKINHALMLGGPPGTGKDTMLVPVRRAIGESNYKIISPDRLLGDFNDFVEAVILLISELHDVGDADRYKLYERMKNYTAAPPNIIPCNKKYRNEYGVMNVCGVVITTNHKVGGIALTANDRRYFVAWSEATKEDFPQSYWTNLYGWYYNESGCEHVSTYLKELSLEDFNPKAPPPKTDAFWDIVNAERPPESAEMSDTLDKLDNPDAITIDMVANAAEADFQYWLKERRNRRRIPYRFEEAGYIQIRNEAAKDGLWKVAGKRSAVYAKQDLSKSDRARAAEALLTESEPITINW